MHLLAAQEPTIFKRVLLSILVVPDDPLLIRYLTKSRITQLRVTTTCGTSTGQQWFPR